MPNTKNKIKNTLTVDDDGYAWECHFEDKGLEEDVGEIIVVVGGDLNEVFGRGVNE